MNKKFEKKLPYVLVNISGTKELVEKIKGFLKICLDWHVTDDIKKYEPFECLVTHGIDGEHVKEEFWIIKKGKLYDRKTKKELK